MPTRSRTAALVAPLAALLPVLATPSAAGAQLDAPPAPAAARAARPVRLGLGGGVIVPRQGASLRTLRQGMHGQGFLEFRLPGGLPALRANVDLARMRVQSPALPTLPAAPFASAARDGSAPGTAAVEETIRTMLAGMASLKLDLLRGPVRPYVLAGVGGVRLADEARRDAGADAARTQLDFGIEGGAGLSIRLGPIDAFAETRLQNVYTQRKGLVDQSTIRAFPVTFGITL